MKDLRFEAKLVKKECLGDKVWQYSFEASREIEISPGMFLSLKVDETGLMRAYSVAGAQDGREFVLVADLSPDGVGSKFLEKLRDGDQVSFLGPFGKFVVSESDLDCEGMVFVATGVGVAPFRWMIENVLERGFLRKIRLFWGVKEKEKAFWDREFEKLQKSAKNFQYILCLSRQSGVGGARDGRVTDVLLGEKVGKKELVFMCGRGEMINEVKEICRSKGVTEENLREEKFA
jgi:NAD(P)H-flavin reductase